MQLGATSKFNRWEADHNQPQETGGAVAAPVAPVRVSERPIYDVDGFIDGLFIPRPWKSWAWLTAWLVPGVYVVHHSGSIAEQVAGLLVAAAGLVLGAGNEASVWVTRLDDSEWHRQAKRWRNGRNVDTGAVYPEAQTSERQPTIKSYGQVYSQDVAMPRINNEIMVARTIWDQRRNGLKVVLTESYWVKGKHWPESREKFAEMKLRWQYGGAIKRKNPANKSSEHIPDDWDVIQKIKRGVRLPTPPAGYIG